jgi:hypothetical protein
VVELAKFGFIAGGVVQLLDFVVRTLAIAITLGAGNMTVVVEIGSPSVFLVVVVEAHLALVLV